MAYYGAKELAEAFRTVRKNTIQVAEDIPTRRMQERMAQMQARTQASKKE